MGSWRQNPGMKRLLCLLMPFLTCLAPPLQAKEEKRVIPITRLAPGQGMVMLRLIANRRLSRFSVKWDKFAVHNLKSGKKYELKDLYGLGHHATFVVSLPVGDYQADEVRVGDPVWQSLGEYGSAGFAPGAWRFKVEPGRMTNLGSIFYLEAFAIEEPPPSTPRAQYKTLSFRLVHMPDDTLPQRSSHLFHPDDHPAVLSKSLGWTSIAPGSSSATLAQFKRMTLSLSGATRATAGGILFGEHFGQIAWRHPDGKWSWEDTGTIESILFAADSPNGTRYAVAEGSVLLQRARPGEWTRIPVALEDATPRMLYAFADGSLLTVWEQFQKFTALRYRPGADPSWTTEWEMPAPRGKVAKMLGYCRSELSPAGVVASSEIFGAFGGIHTKKVALLDFTTGKWTHSETDVHGSAAILPDGTIYSLTGGNDNQTFKVSRNAGLQWEDRSTGTFAMIQPRFRTADDGLTFAISKWAPGTLTRTLDGGRTWQAVGELPMGTNWLYVLPGQELLMATELGRLYSSQNNGKNWRVERDANAGR